MKKQNFKDCFSPPPSYCLQQLLLTWNHICKIPYRSFTAIIFETFLLLAMSRHTAQNSIYQSMQILRRVFTRIWKEKWPTAKNPKSNHFVLFSKSRVASLRLQGGSNMSVAEWEQAVTQMRNTQFFSLAFTQHVCPRD